MNQWSPIETAPKDETIDLWCVSNDNNWSGRFIDCHWDDDLETWIIAEGDCLDAYEVVATHWMRVYGPIKG